MIHLDHNHSSSIPAHANSPTLSVLPPNAPHAPSSDQQHAILPWTSPSRDQSQRAFYPDSQEQQFPNPQDASVPPPDSQQLADKAQQDPPPAPPAVDPLPPPSTNAEAPSHSEPSPNSPADARSPPADSTSSLTPPPDAATPNPATEAPDDPPGKTAPAPSDSAAMPDNAPPPSQQQQQQTADDVEKASRQSTPLSELSSAPETAPDDENTAADGSSTKGTDGGAKETNGGEGNGVSKDGLSAGADRDGAAVASSQQSSSAEAGSLPQQNTSTGAVAGQQAHPGGDQGASVGGLAPHKSHHQAMGQSAMPDGTPSRQHSQSSLSPTHSKAPSHDPKVVSILELNSLLLRVSMEFQARGVPMQDPNFNQYSLRLQSNLTWLAAAADENHKVSQNLLALPVMTPPPVVEFTEMDRILHLYRELPSIFAKELARRQQSGAPGVPGGQGGFVNGSVKRERTEEPGPEGMHKRRDTGESKAQTPSGFSTPGAGPSTPHPPAQSNMQPQMPNHPGQMGMGMGMNMNMNMHMAGGPVPRMGSPSMPPPPLTPAQIAQLQAIGPNAVQHFQLLQNPRHGFVQYLVQQVPGFMSLPLQDKLQKMQMAQNIFQARRSAAAQQQAGGSMGPFPQGGGMPGPIAPQHSGDGSPSRIPPSPTAAAAPAPARPTTRARCSPPSNKRR
ncbi:hypothetical protein FKP32DRAFT_1603650 [Trametes sanguinea]|nr:hypothetical protein FKP32DRAFT_1603650 [Trametes sanguinea]